MSFRTSVRSLNRNATSQLRTVIQRSPAPFLTTFLRISPSPVIQASIKSFSTTPSKMSSNHSHLRAASLFDMSGFTAVVTGGGTGEPRSLIPQRSWKKNSKTNAYSYLCRSLLGIGLMCTLALVENGCKVYITGRKKEKLDSVVRQYSGDVKERGEIIA